MKKLKERCHCISDNVGLLATVCMASSVLGLVLGVNSWTTVRAKQIERYRDPSSSTRNNGNPPKPIQPSVRQSDEKRVEVSARSDELLEFSGFSVRNVKISPNQKFSTKALETGGRPVGDWLEDFEFRLRNRSGKQITYILFELQFPDTEINGPLMVYREWRVGVPPNASTDALRSGAEPLALNSGDTTIVTLSAKHLQRIKHFIGLRNFQLSEIDRVVVNILSVFFDDGMKWESGVYYRLNPSVPGGYERIGRTVSR